MCLYMYRAKYSQEAVKGMLAKPEDRTASLRAMYEAAGVKLLHLWLLPNWEVMAIVEGDPIKNTSIGAVTYASGAVTEASATELMTFEQLAEATKLGGALAAKYRPPSK